MAEFLNVVRFNPTAGGTTDWTFSTAVTGYQSPALAGVVNGTLYKYRAESADLTQWELGEGAYNTGTGVLARTTVLYNSAGTGTGSGQSGAGTKINFTLTPQVAVVALKEDLPGLTLNNSFSGTQTVTNATAATSTTTGAVIITGGASTSDAVWAAKQFASIRASTAGGHIDVASASGYSVANTANTTVLPSASFFCTVIETAIAGYVAAFFCTSGNQPFLIFSSSTNFVSGVNVAAKFSLGWDGSVFRIYNNLGAGTAVFRVFAVAL